jgi:hypothetical protein
VGWHQKSLIASPRSIWQVLCLVRRCYYLRSTWQVCSPIWYADSRYATTTTVFCTTASGLELAFPRSIWQCRNLRLKKLSTSSPSALPFSTPSSSRPRYNSCLHLLKRTSPFRKLQHKTSSRSPQTTSALPLLTHKNFAKERKNNAHVCRLNTHPLIRIQHFCTSYVN